MTDIPVLQPLLRRYPDAHKARAPLLEPILLPYVALMFGAFIAALVGSYNALLLKRPALILKSLLVGIAASFSFVLVIMVLQQFGVTDRRVAFILGRFVHFGFGGLLYFLHRPHFRGHQYLGGPAVPLLPSYLAAIVISVMVPNPAPLMFIGVPFVR